MTNNNKITKVEAIEVLDSRGNPTVQAAVYSGKIKAVANVPSGKSVGKHEALELRDRDPKRYLGLGVLKSVKNIEDIIGPRLKGIEVKDQRKIDQIMIDLDGTGNKSKLGANSILAVSLASARLAAMISDVPLYKHLSKYWKTVPSMPVPLVNIVNGGEHADNNLDLQEFIIIPRKEKFAEMVRKSSEVFHNLGLVFQSRGMDTDVGNEGGYAPDFENNNEVFENIVAAIKKSSYVLGKDFTLGIDAGASTFYQEDGSYYLKMDKTKLSPERLLSLYNEWVNRYDLTSIEDGFAEDDLYGWQGITSKLGGSTLLIGDDLFVTNVKRLKWGIENGIANAVLIKPNQIGTITETVETIKLARQNKYQVIVSHRSGDTPDSFIADLAYAMGADYIKAGSISRGERLAKYNRLIEIEHEINKNK